MERDYTKGSPAAGAGGFLQGLKPEFFATLFGTAEAVPFPKRRPKAASTPARGMAVSRVATRLPTQNASGVIPRHASGQGGRAHPSQGEGWGSRQVKASG